MFVSPFLFDIVRFHFSSVIFVPAHDCYRYALANHNFVIRELAQHVEPRIIIMRHIHYRRVVIHLHEEVVRSGPGYAVAKNA